MQGEIHHAAINEPILVGTRGFVGMGLRWQFGATFAHMRDIVIDLLVEGHDPRHGPHRNVGMSQETPNPKLAGIGMAFLQVIHLQHHGQPDLAYRRFRCPALILKPC